MRILAGVVLVAALASDAALADGFNLAGSYWQCSRASDLTQFVIAFYPGGGVGAGELRRGVISPYIFDATNVRDDEWPGQWEQNGDQFTWRFPDHNKEISGQIDAERPGKARLSGTEIAGAERSTIGCTELSKLPRIGSDFVVPRDPRFIDLDGDEGVLKVPAGISLVPQLGR